MKTLSIVVCVLWLAAAAHAQTVVGDRLRLNAGPCVVSSQAGPPIELVLTGSCSGITTSAATNLTLNPTGDLITDPAGKDLLPNLNYDINIGMLSKKYLTLHAAELWVETLVAQNTIATIGGRILVAPTNTLTSDLAPGATSILVKYNNLANGDRIYMEANGAVEFMAVTSSASGSGPYTYSVTRNLDGSGANQWYAGDALLDTGTTGNGFIDLYSTAGVLASGSGPSIVGNVRTGTAYNAYAPRWAIGNLNGLYGYGATTYGAAFGDSAGTNVTVDATNGFRIRSGTTNKFLADTSGNLSIVGDLSVGTSGSIRSGASGYSTGTGWYMDFNGGTPRFRIGDPAGNRLTWDGTTLSVFGDGGGITNINGGNIQTDTITATQIAANAITTSELNADSVTSAKIAAGTIVASDIAAGSITADRLSVATLSAITANLGSVTAGSITGVTGTIGGCTMSSTTLTCGSTTLDSNGLSITTGSGGSHNVKWSDGSAIFGNSGTLVHESSSDMQFNVAGVYLLNWNGAGLYSTNGNASLGNSTRRWPDFFLANSLNWSNPPTTMSDDYPMVYSTGNTQIYRKTNGTSGGSLCAGTGVESISVDRGIVVGVSCF